MADPGTAFKNNPHEQCTIDLRLTAASEPSGGEPIYDEGEEPPPGVAHSFAKGHTEQQMAITGRASSVNGQRFDLDRAFGLRDHSWGPARVAEHLVVPLGHRQLRRPTSASRARSRGHEDDPDLRNVNGWVFDLDRYGDGRVVQGARHAAHLRLRRRVVRAPQRRRHHHRRPPRTSCTARCASSIPLRNRRDGMVTRLTEGITRWTCGDRDGRRAVGVPRPDRR